MCKEWFLSNNKKPIFTISGCAGSGKSTIVSTLQNELGLSLNKKEIIFCCFTGKATSVLVKKGVPAQTIHSLIYEVVEDPDTGIIKGFVTRNLKKFKEEYPNLKLLIVDEVSMVSKEMLNDLVAFKIPIICVGDSYQLQPIKGKSCLTDCDVMLTQPLRQALESDIIKVANDIKEGNFPDLTANYNNVNFIKKQDLDPYKLTKSGIIISGTNNNVKNINRAYRKTILGIENDEPIVGDKIICKENNWQKCVNDGFKIFLVNGLSGIITKIKEPHNKDFQSKDVGTLYFQPEETTKEFKTLSYDHYLLTHFTNDPLYLQANDMNIYNARSGKYPYYGRFKIGRYSHRTGKMEFEQVNKFLYGYAITGHASQGSQAKEVSVFLEPRYINDFRWLYTCFTRAEETLNIIY